MAVSGGSFVDEIYDQFLVCRMCSKVYNNPKVLTCMHSFCEKCLETHYDMEEQERPYRFLVYNRALNCPLCHSRTELPTGGIHRLPDNFLVANLSAVVGRCKPIPNSSSPAASVCEICRPPPPGAPHNEAATTAEEGEERAAVSRCLDCVKLLCAACTELHRKTRVTERHGLFDVRRGPPEADPDSTECKRHRREALRFYCEECAECVCVLCTFHDHRDHDVTTLVDALDRHRRPFEALMERCRARIDGLRARVALIERCERGLKTAEERIRDAAIDAIAAIRKREKVLLAEIRDSLDEQTMNFIGEKNVFKENLKNLEGSFDATGAMLTGTKIDLLIVRKEMEKKLTAILETGLKNTPDSLERSVRWCSDEADKEDHYPDVVQDAFDRMEKSSRFVVFGETRIQAVDAQTETDPELTPDLISKLDQKDNDPDTSSSTPDPRRDPAAWRRPMPVVVATEAPRSFGTITLRPIDGLPRTGEAATQTSRPVLVDGATEMPRLVVYEKETNTPFVHVLQKGVSTDNQTMVDKSTSTTLVDVTAAYRGAATTKRSVMVSRGTCTPRTMTVDRETLSVPCPMVAVRGCSPVDWTGVSAKGENEGAEGNSPILQAPQNYSVDHVTGKREQENATTTVTVRSSPAVVGVSGPAVVGVLGASKTPAPLYKQDEQKLSPPVTLIHQPPPAAAAAAVNRSTPTSAATQIRPHEGQGSSRGQEVSKNLVNTSAPRNQIQVGKVVIEEPASLPSVQLMPVSSQGDKELIRGVPALPGSNPVPGIKGGQLRSQAPGSLPGSQSLIGNQRSQVRPQGSTSVPGVQITPESQRFQAPIASPGVNYMPTTQGTQVRAIGPANVPGVQSIPRTQGNQVRTTGPTNVSGVQSIPGTQGSQVRTIGPTNVPGVQSIAGTQGSQVRTQYTPPEAVTGRVLTGTQTVSSIASTPATVEANSTLTTQAGQVSKQNGEAKTVTSTDNSFHNKDPAASLSIKDYGSETLKAMATEAEKPVADYYYSLPAIQMPAPVGLQRVTGSQVQSSPGENIRQNAFSPTATTPANRDVTVAAAGTAPPAEAAVTSTTEKSVSENNDRRSNAWKESTTASRVPPSFLPSSTIVAPQATEIVQAASRAPAGGAAAAERPNPGISAGSYSVAPGSQFPSQLVGVGSNPIATRSPNVVPGLASKLPGSFPAQKKPGGAIIEGKGTSQDAASKMPSAAETRNGPRSGEAAAAAAAAAAPSGNLVAPVSTSPSISQLLLVNDAVNKSAAENHPQTSPVRENATTTSGGNKPDENPQNPTIPIRSDDKPNPSTDRPTQSPHQKTANPEK